MLKIQTQIKIKTKSSQNPPQFRIESRGMPEQVRDDIYVVWFFL